MATGPQQVELQEQSAEMCFMPSGHSHMRPLLRMPCSNTARVTPTTVEYFILRGEILPAGATGQQGPQQVQPTTGAVARPRISKN